jgi:hypothetical protein
MPGPRSGSRKGGVFLLGVFLGKLLLLVFHSKALLVTVVLITGVVVTGVAGPKAVNLVITVMAAPLAYPTDPVIQIDEPKLGVFITGTVEVNGWAVDRNGKEGPEIERVTVYLDGVAGENKLGDATYGLDRPDVAGLLDEPRFSKSGWTFSWSAGTVEGNHTLFVVARAKSGRVSLALREVNDPLVRFDLPVSGAKIHQEDVVEIAGWAIDRSDLEGDGMASVTLYLDAKDDGHRLGVTTLDRESADIADLYGERFGNSGWTFTWDVGQTGTGDHMLIAVARSSVSGHETTTTRKVEVKEIEDEDLGPGCSDWAHARNDAWHAVHGYWQTARAELQGLRKEGRGGKGSAQAAVNGARSSMDSTVRGAHSEIQALALSHKCETGAAMDAAYAQIVNEAQTNIDRTLAAAKIAVALLPTDAPGRGNAGNGRGRP